MRSRVFGETEGWPPKARETKTGVTPNWRAISLLCAHLDGYADLKSLL